MQIIIEYDYNGNKTFEGYISLKNAASVAVAAGAVANNVLNQGVGNITGSQKGFSWSSVAISAVGATAGAYASDKLGLNVKNPSVGQDLGRAAVNAGANALSQLAIRGGKINWQQVATDTILNFAQNTGQRYANANALNDAQIAKAKQTPVAGINANDDPTYSTRPKGSFTQELLSSSQVEAAAFNSGGQVTPLLFSNDVSAGGAAGGSIAERIARTGALVNGYVGSAGDVGVVFSKDQYMNGMPNANKSATNLVLEGVQQVNKLNITGEDGLRIGPTIERAKLLSANNTVLRDENGFIIRPLSDFIEASPQATIRATSNLVKDNPIIMSPVRFAGDVVSLFRADGVNPATGEVATNLNKPYAKLGLAIDAAATFSPLVELRGVAGVAKVEASSISNLPRYLYNYTDNITASMIEKTQLGLPGRITYLTPQGGLSPIQAQIELALPQKNTATSLFQISTDGLDSSKVLINRRVNGNVFDRGGGGTEILYNGTIPLENVKRIK